MVKEKITCPLCVSGRVLNININTSGDIHTEFETCKMCNGTSYVDEDNYEYQLYILEKKL